MSRFQRFMTRRFGGAMSIKYDDQGNPTVTLYGDSWAKVDRKVLEGEEAKAFLRKYDRRTGFLQILFLPVSAVFYVIVGIHNFTEWLLGKFFGVGK